MAKDAYYFSHDTNARNDVKILMLRQKFGWEGYGLFWALIEAMAESSEYQLDNTVITALSFSYNTDYNTLNSVIEYCCEIGLFKNENGIFWSNSLKNRMALKVVKFEQKSRAGKKGMAKRWGKNNTVITDDNTVITDDNNKRKVNESKINRDRIQSLWVKTFGRNPKYPEREETQKLIKKFGESKVYQIFKEATLSGFKNLGTLINSLDVEGNIRPKSESQKETTLTLRS